MTDQLQQKISTRQTEVQCGLTGGTPHFIYNLQFPEVDVDDKHGS